MDITAALVPEGAHQGRAIGALVMTAFGAIWMISGANALSLLNWEIWLIVAILTGLLGLVALLRLQAARRIPKTPATASQSKSIQTLRRRFGIILAFEWVPILLVAFVFGRTGHPDFILPAIAVIVGLHFIPLARLFNSPLYYWTGIGFVLVSVADRGLGIDPEDLPHIFDAFYRGRSVIEAQIHGTGLGLSLAKSFAQAAGGNISVVSSPGEGACFTLRLPAAKPVLEAPQQLLAGRTV